MHRRGDLSMEISSHEMSPVTSSLLLCYEHIKESHILWRHWYLSQPHSVAPFVPITSQEVVEIVGQTEHATDWG